MVVVWAAVVLLVLATAGWMASLARRNANVVDQLWGFAPVAVAVTCLAVGDERTVRSWLGAAMVAMWGIRLTAHLVVRDREGDEDWRHREARARHPRFAWRSLPELFWVQLVGGGLVVGSPMFAVVAGGQPPLRWLDALGVVLWGLGFTVEVVADRQLARFRSDPANHGRLLDRGLWAYSRHPNYFGEALLWTGIALVGVAAGTWWALLSPAMVLVIVLRITGVRAMDTHLLATRGTRYADYVRTTSPFVPLPKRDRIRLSR